VSGRKGGLGRGRGRRAGRDSPAGRLPRRGGSARRRRAARQRRAAAAREGRPEPDPPAARCTAAARERLHDGGGGSGGGRGAAAGRAAAARALRADGDGLRRLGRRAAKGSARIGRARPRPPGPARLASIFRPPPLPIRVLNRLCSARHGPSRPSPAGWPLIFCLAGPRPTRIGSACPSDAPARAQPSPGLSLACALPRRHASCPPQPHEPLTHPRAPAPPLHLCTACPSPARGSGAAGQRGCGVRGVGHGAVGLGPRGPTGGERFDHFSSQVVKPLQAARPATICVRPHAFDLLRLTT
jgi:hypothetical protein